MPKPKFIQVTAVPTGADLTLIALDEQGQVWRLDPGQPKWKEVPGEREGDEGVTSIRVVLADQEIVIGREGKEGA